MNERATNIAQRLAIARLHRVFPGCAAGITASNSEPTLIALGTSTFESDSTADTATVTGADSTITPDSVFDVASITKTLPTGVLGLWAWEQKLWHPDVLLADVVPHYHGDGANSLTIGQLLRFEVPFDLTLSALKDQPAEDILETVLGAALAGPAGQRRAYLNTTSLLLGLALETVTQQPLDQLAKEIIFQPLQLQHTGFRPQEFTSRNNIVPTEHDPWRNRAMQGEVHDESAWKLQSMMTPGSAGLFTSARDLATILQAILNRQGPFSDPLVQRLSQGWGSEVGSQWLQTAPAETFGKTGYTGCHFAVNLERNTASFLLSNFNWPHRPKDRRPLTQLRQDLNQLTFTG